MGLGFFQNFRWEMGLGPPHSPKICQGMMVWKPGTPEVEEYLTVHKFFVSNFTKYYSSWLRFSPQLSLLDNVLR